MAGSSALSSVYHLARVGSRNGAKLLMVPASGSALARVVETWFIVAILPCQITFDGFVDVDA